LTIPCFEKLKCFGVVEKTIEFESTFYIIASLAIGPRNKTSWSEIVCSTMHYATLLMALLGRV